jgi:hypothetical protein
MMNVNKFRDLFPVDKPVIGMIHLAGEGKEKIRRALEELSIYEEEGVNGAIIEDYYGSVEDVFEALGQSSGLNIVRGVNVLRNPYSGFRLAQDFGAKFVQFDSVQTKDLGLKLYEEQRAKYPEIVVLGGVGFKYIAPTGNSLEVDLRDGKLRCEAIVTTGSGTGVETPIQKLREYKKLLGEFPLIVGAGVNLQNVYEQLQICNGAIIGSCFKPNGNTYDFVDRKRVRALMDIVKEVCNK